MFMDPGPSPFELKFHLLGIPVRVHPWFWLMSLILGSNTLRYGIEYLLLWVACVFVSVLIHEMGHAVMGRVFGNWGEIVLYGFGGLAMGASGLANRWKRIAVYFAGPLAGFLFLGIVILCLPLVAPEEWKSLTSQVRLLVGLPVNAEDVPDLLTLKGQTLGYLFWINLAWGLVNLLPIWPLDGGQISRDLFDWLLPSNGISVALGISLVAAGLLAVNGVLGMGTLGGRPFLPIPIGGWWSVLLFGSLAVGSLQALQAEQSRRAWVDDHFSRWERDEDREDSYRGR
jgi:Zn-dependent protease